MNIFSHSRRLISPLAFKILAVLSVLAVSVSVAGGAAAAKTNVDENQLTASGFKVLVAATDLQKEWVQRLPVGEIRPVQRNNKKYFIYPDASNNQIYVGGPKEYAAYKQLNPDSRLPTQDAAKQGTDYRLKQDDSMKKATARDLSDPFLGVSWIDLMW